MTTHNTENLFVNQRIHFTNWRWKVEFYEGFINYLWTSVHMNWWMETLCMLTIRNASFDVNLISILLSLHVKNFFVLFSIAKKFCYAVRYLYALQCVLHTLSLLPIWAIWYNKCECVIITWPIKYCSWSMLNHLVNCKLNRNRQNDTN